MEPKNRKETSDQGDEPGVLRVIIFEHGNGLPGHGDMVYCSHTNTLLCITTPDSDIRITINGSGVGNSIEVDVVEDGRDPTDLTEEEWDNLIDVGVMIVGD